MNIFAQKAKKNKTPGKIKEIFSSGWADNFLFGIE